jgi:hypothetical protein
VAGRQRSLQAAQGAEGIAIGDAGGALLGGRLLVDADDRDLRIPGQDGEVLLLSLGMSPAWISEVLPAPEGEYSSTIRSAMSRSTSRWISTSRPKSRSPIRKERGPT